jgi:diacylglycerol kinase (ATP)
VPAGGLVWFLRNVLQRMKSVQLIHNPGAGDQKFDGGDLLRLLQKNGYDCGYLSTKQEAWKENMTKKDLLIIAGGDGTVRKVAGQILENRLLDKPEQLAILPFGTANNIARTLHITDDIQKNILSWKRGRTKACDIGEVGNLRGENFFLESFGFGVFPYLMLEMKKLDNDLNSPEESMNLAWELLHRIILSYDARQCDFEIDGVAYSGKFLLVEIMNTPFIGPNLQISPLSDPGDGEFEMVLVAEQHKEKLAKYVAGKLNGQEELFSFQTIKGKKIKISWEGSHVHLDDQIVKVEQGAELAVRLKKKKLHFLVP